MTTDETAVIDVLTKLHRDGYTPNRVKHFPEKLNMVVGAYKLWPVTRPVLDRIVALWPHLAEDVAKINPADEEPHKPKWCDDK
jgi:hypothetical protein